MDKEIVNTFMLKQQLKKYGRNHVFPATISLSVVFILLWLLKILLDVFFKKWFVLAYVGILGAVFLIPMIGVICVGVRYIRASQDEPVVVKANCCKEPSVRSKKRIAQLFLRSFFSDRETHEYHFDHFGPLNAERVSAGSDEEVSYSAIWECTMIGDPFYLVLDRKFRIIYAYQGNSVLYDGPLFSPVLEDGKVVCVRPAARETIETDEASWERFL